MQAPVFLLEIQHLKQLKSVFLKIYNCAWKPAFLKSSHIFVTAVWFAVAKGGSDEDGHVPVQPLWSAFLSVRYVLWL